MRARSYDMFSFLFGHDGRMPTQYEPRGIPEDVNRQTMRRLLKKNLLRVRHVVKFTKPHPGVTVTDKEYRRCKLDERGQGGYKPHEVEHFYGDWEKGDEAELPVDVISELVHSFYTTKQRRTTFETRSDSGGHHMTHLTLDDIESVDWSIGCDRKAVHVYRDGQLCSVHSLDSHSDPSLVERLENGERVSQDRRDLEYKQITGESLLTPDWRALFDVMRAFRPVVSNDEDIRLVAWFGS